MRYAKDFLTSVVYEIRFSPILALKKDAPAAYQTLIQTEFPHVEEQLELGVSAAVTAQSALQANIQEQKSIWVFMIPDRTAALSVACDFLRLEFRRYPGIERMKADFGLLWEKFQATYPVQTLTRAGLRYINQVSLPTGDALDWKGYIGQHLIDAALGVGRSDGSRLARSWHEMHWTAEDHRMAFRFGIFNSDFPSPVAHREFILDYDCFSIGESPAAAAVELLGRYNGYVDVMFEASIGDELRHVMGAG